MIKVGLFIDTYFPMVDGVINVVDNYAKRLNDEEFQVIVFAPKTRNKKYVDNFSYKLQRCKSVKIFFLDYDLPLPRFDRKFKKTLKESNLDIVHIHSPFGVAKMGIRYAKKHNIPVVATLHSQFEKDIFQSSKSKLITKIMLKSIMRVFNRCDEYYAVNSKISQVFLRYGTKHLPPVQRNGTDMTPVKDETKALEMVNKKFNLRADENVFLFVGRINVLKNILFTVQALSKLKDQNFKMFFVGDGVDMDKLKKEIEKYHLQDKVILTGKIYDRELLECLYLRAKLFLFPSMYDASSLVQIEAASQKTPTLFLKDSATSATVTENVNGFLADPTPEAYARKIEEILADEKLYKTVQEGAVRDLFVTWDDTVKEMKEKYKQQIALKQTSKLKKSKK